MFILLRIKNESRWIARVIASVQPVADKIIVLDDHSTDGTPEICESLGCMVYRSEFTGINEARDKDFLLHLAWENGAQLNEYCLMIDGDEALHQDDIPALRQAILEGNSCYSLRVVYLWDREDQARVDGVYRSFCRPSLFRLTGKHLTFANTGFGGNLHCTSSPLQLLNAIRPSPVRLLHFGYLHSADRIRKYHWYNSIDPGSAYEDFYRHVVQGDIPEVPASAQLMHAGPLRLEAI